MVAVGRLVAAAAVLAAMAAPPAEAAAKKKRYPFKPLPGCAAKESPGGEWRRYGHDYANTRHQPRSAALGRREAARLGVAWSFFSPDGGGEGDVPGTPIVADGCVYFGTSRGWVFALNADSGKLAWKAKVPYGGGVLGSVAVARKRVFVGVTRRQPAEGCPAGDPCTGPYAAAFNQRTGKLMWATAPIDTQNGSEIFSSAIVFKGVLMLGVSGGAAELGDPADRDRFQGHMTFLDTLTGRVIRRTWTIHPRGEPDDDFAGGGIWSTPAIDTERGVAYVGTANPFRPQVEHERTNAVIRLDVDPASRTFGAITGSYKGNLDEYLPGLSKLPCYDLPGNPPPYYPQGLGSCGDIDMDFGAAPNLLEGPRGRLLVGAGQKSGVYHVFDARTMKPEWSQIVGPPTQLGGIVGSTAYDGRAIYGPITVGGYLWSISARDGAWRWFAPVLDGVHWGPPVSVAGGVAYTVGLLGFLDAYDARNGTQVAKVRLPAAASSGSSASWGSVAVARGTVYATIGTSAGPAGGVVAFKPGARGGGGGGGGGTPGGGGTRGAVIVAGPGSTYSTYLTPLMVVRAGGPLSFMNLDVVPHDVVATDKGPDGRPLFRSALAGLGEVLPVEGMDRVQSGRAYGFFCSIHPGMRGSLIVS